MTIERIMGFVLGTILVGIGLKIGEMAYKEVSTSIKTTIKTLKEDANGGDVPQPEGPYKRPCMNPTIVA
jgi:hypothetical protein